MMSRAFKTAKAIGLVALASVVAIVIIIALFVPLPSQAIHNQRELLSLLRKAHLEMTPTGTPEVKRVALAGRVTLVPERDQIAAGYILRLHIQSSTFTIEANPVQVGKTGLFSFFRDKFGIVRFEPEIGKPANENSRPWGRALLEGQH